MAALMDKASSFNNKASAGCNFPAKSSSDDEADEEEEKRTHLVVSSDEVCRVRVEHLLEELFEGRRKVPRCTRDSWVQTTTEVEIGEAAATLLPPQPMVAPLASEEEFCSDTEQKPKFVPMHEGHLKFQPCSERSPLPQVRQPSAIAEVDQRVIVSQVVSMPGSRDLCGRSVVYVSLRNMQEHGIAAVELAEVLLYFQTIPKKESMCLGFLMVVDGRGASAGTWNLLQKTLAVVEETVPGTISLVLILHLQNQSSDFLSSKYPIFHLKFEAIVNENQLLKYISKDQLLPEFSGTFAYDYQEWIKLHQFLDPFVIGCQQMGCRLVQLIQELRCEQLPTVLSHQLIEEQKRKIADVLEDKRLKYLEEEGGGFLRRLEDKRRLFEGSHDFNEAVEKSQLLYKQLLKVVQRLARLADKRLNKLQECMMRKTFEEESSQVLTWLNRNGEETLKKHKTLAETLNAIREQENEFEKFYFLAMRQIERGNDLLEEIPRVREKELSTHLKKQLDDFTDRLEDARERLEDTARCYTLLDKTYEWALETMRFVSHMKVDSSTPVSVLVAISKRLDSYLQTHPYIEDSVFEDMNQLTKKLNNDQLVGQCKTAREKYEETVKLIQARRDALSNAKERLNFEEICNINESLDNLKIKPCLWNPLSHNVPYRTSSQTYLGSYNPNMGSQNLRREAIGSYTAFPSSYYPSVSFRDRLLGRKNRMEYFSKRGSLTEDLFLRLNRSETDEPKRQEQFERSCGSETNALPAHRPSFVNYLNIDLNSRSVENSIDGIAKHHVSSPLLARRRTSLPVSCESPIVAKQIHPDLDGVSVESEERTQYPFSRNSESAYPESDTNSAFKPPSESEMMGENVKSDRSSSSESLTNAVNSVYPNRHVVLRGGRKSYPFSASDSMTDLNVRSARVAESSSNLGSSSKLEDERNWKACEADLKRFADEVREQNRVLEEIRVSGQQDAVSSRHKQESVSSRRHSHASNEEGGMLSKRPAPVNSHLMRCASCSDFEELLSTKNSNMEALNMANNRTLKLIMMEMVQTERDYVKSLGYIIENYVPLLQNTSVSQSLRSQRNIIFGNIEKIYEFHNCFFLEELEQCESVPYSVGQCFLKYESQFYLYAMYNKNKPKSDNLMAEYGNNFFKKKQLELGDKMDLASYLLKPVQRMGKYALLLKQLLKECPESNSEHYNNLKAAEEMVRFQLRHGNDLLAMDALRECDVNIKEQGRLLRQDEFLVWQGKKKALRHVFLFEDLILFSKARRDPQGHDSYQYKSSIKTSDLGLTAQVGESPTKFEIWFRKCKAQDLYVLQAPSSGVKDNWVEEISMLLWKQAERNRNLRLEEMSSMGIGNKPCLDITPSRDQICDRSISLQQLNKVPRFRNSIAVSSSDNFNNNNEPRRRPLSIISLMSSGSSGEQQTSTFYDTSRTLEEEEEEPADKRRSMAQQSQCSAESGIFMDLSTSGDSYAENVQRLKTVERCDSVISRTSYNSIEAAPTAEPRPTETSTSTSSHSGLAV